MEIPGADISVSTYIERSLVWNFHTSWVATDVSDWLLQLALAHCINTAADDQSFISYFQHILVDIMADKVIDSLFDRVIKRLSPAVLYRPYIKPSVDNCPRLRLWQLSTFGLDIRADMKTAV